MAQFSYYLNAELYIDSDLSILELESLIEDLLGAARGNAQITPVSVDLHSPRKA